jgi:hypothetical protein
MKRWRLFCVVAATLTTVACGGPGSVGIYARTAPPPIRVESYGPAPGPGYVGIGVIAATITPGLAGVGNGLHAVGIVGKTGAGNIAATAINGVVGAGVKTPKRGVR